MPPPYPGQVPPPYGPPPQQTTNWWAVVSLVFGLFGGILISVIAGIVALNKAKSGRPGRGMAIAGLVLSAVWAVVIAVGIAFVVFSEGDSVDAADVKVGDCIVEIPDGSRVAFIDVVACEEPHKGEVFTILTMPEGDFPGQMAMARYQDRCAPALATYAPSAVTDPDVGLFVLYPTEESWGRGDRAVTCIATSDATRTGTLKG
jgi:hypothetical protein